jgi:NAD(P)-dependent dehydrogenase (short-subunit alcohol dehydrogenase family)
MRKVAVVTGCSYGLGHDIADRLIDEGYFVYGLSRTKPSIKLFAAPDTFQWIECDISKSDQVKAAFERIGTYIDVLVNNAGVYEWGLFKSYFTIEKIDKIIDLNVKGTIYVTKEALKLMNKGSDIIFINSVAGLNEMEWEAVYSASKHAITAFAGALGAELNTQMDEIRVTSIHPGGIKTSMQEKHPSKDKFLETKEITNTIVHVLNSKARYKTIKLFSDIEWH